MVLKFIWKVSGTVVEVLTAACIIQGLAGCSNMYEGFRAAKIEDCYKLNYPEQQECLREVDINYQTYDQERKQVSKVK